MKTPPEPFVPLPNSDVDAFIAALEIQFANDMPRAPTSNLISYLVCPENVLEDAPTKAFMKQLSKEQIVRVGAKIIELLAAEINLRIPPRRPS